MNVDLNEAQCFVASWRNDFQSVQIRTSVADSSSIFNHFDVCVKNEIWSGTEIQLFWTQIRLNSSFGPQKDEFQSRTQIRSGKEINENNLKNTVMYTEHCQRSA